MCRPRPICVYEHDDIGLADAFSYHTVTVNADAACFDVISEKIFVGDDNCRNCPPLISLWDTV